VVLPTQGNSERGLGLSRVRAGSIPAQLGLRDGDVLISLNGTNLASLAAPRALADALAHTNEATLVYERANQQRTLTIVRTRKD
jgi:S1-C subfamily serine protease